MDLVSAVSSPRLALFVLFLTLVWLGTRRRPLRVESNLIRWLAIAGLVVFVAGFGLCGAWGVLAGGGGLLAGGGDALALLMVILGSTGLVLAWLGWRVARRLRAPAPVDPAPAPVDRPGAPPVASPPATPVPDTATQPPPEEP